MKMWNILLFLSLALVFLVMLNAPVSAEDSAPAKKSFNDYVLQVLETYPTDGSYPYDWVDEPDYRGITKDLFYQGEQFVKGDPRKRSYCSGITFEVFFQAYELCNKDYTLPQIGNLLNAQQMEAFRLQWYGTNGDKLTIKTALETSGLGYQLTDLNQVKPGDFVQIWRWSGSGHTVVFIDWIKDDQGNFLGFKYWSSNSGKGPSYRTEYFGSYGTFIKKEETYFMRVIEPAEWWKAHQQ